MDFRSDNVTGAHPAILEALVAANAGNESAYGEDAHTSRLTRTLSRVFERDVVVLPVISGTAANALALALHTPPWGAVYTHQHAHVQVSECGAVEFFSAGAKLVSVAEDGGAGKISGASVQRAIHREGAVHAVQPAAISVSQASELGSVYGAHELRALSEVAGAHGMHLHVDGARFANALVASGASPADLTWRAGVDVLSLGGTKNGCLMAEALVLFDPTRAREAELRRKRAGHLVSKLRFVSAQLEAYFAGDLWLSNAGAANTRARELADVFTRHGLALSTPVETNQVFVVLSDDTCARLRAGGAQFYDWPTGGTNVRRFVTAFDTAAGAVAAFASLLALVTERRTS